VDEEGLPFVAEMEARWQAAWREENAFAMPAAEEGRLGVRVSPGASSLSEHVTLDQARRCVLADAHARFRRMSGDAVLFSLGFEPDMSSEGDDDPQPGDAAKDTAEKREQLESLGLSIDWSRSYESGEAASERWSQQIFLILADAGIVHRGEVVMHWCENCRTLLPEGDGGGESCHLCEGPIRRMPAGQWYLKIDANAKAEGEPPDGPLHIASPMAGLPADLLGRVEGVEFDTKALNGTPLLLFTPFPEKIEEAQFVAVSPSHPALESLTQDPGLQGRIAALRSGSDSGDGNLGFPSLMDTGAWVHVPGLADPLPLVVSLAVDARFGVTAVLGIPSADPHDEQLSKHLPPPPSLRWDLKVKPSKVRPAVRFRAHGLPISSSDRGMGTPLPVVRCSDCGVVPVPIEALPLPKDSECVCPKCDKPAQSEAGVLDPKVAAWAEMLVAIPPADRATAALDHPELRRWMLASQSLHASDSRAAPLCSLVALEALRDLEVTDLVPNGNARSLVVGKLEASATPTDANGADALAGQVGADTLRFALLHAAVPSKRFGGEELDAVLLSSGRFLKRLWSFAEARLDPGQAGQASIDTSDRLRRRLAKWCDIALRKITENNTKLEGHRAARNVEALLARIEDFERRARDERGELTAEDTAAVRFALCRLVVLLAPIAPHVCEELWQRAGNPDWVIRAPWPEPLLAG
jgi:leucyl-tRNA synthetase